MLLDDSLKKIKRGQHPEATLACFKEHFHHNLNLPLDEVSVHTFLSAWRPDYWLACNKHWFEWVPPDAPTTSKNAKYTFHLLVRIHKRHCTREVFDCDWLVDGIVGCGLGSPGTSLRSSLGFLFLCFFLVVTFPMKVWGLPLVVALWLNF